MERIPMSDIVDRSRESGRLARQFYLVHTRPTGSLDDVLAHSPEHLAYYDDLARRGLIHSAGPLFSSDGSSWCGEGLIVVRSDSLDAVRRIADEDVMHTSGVRTYTVTPWLVNHAAGQN